jgi:hypothetical protein
MTLQEGREREKGDKMRREANLRTESVSLPDSKFGTEFGRQQGEGILLLLSSAQIKRWNLPRE